jgi:hypothetical protein
MKIKNGCTTSTDDFWYDITDGGYLKPEEILESDEDIKQVNSAIKILKEFEDSCERQIEGFFI